MTSWHVFDTVVAALLKGRTEPRLYPAPLRPLTPETSLGFEVIEFAEDVLGLTLRPWQKWLFIHALELDPESDTYDFRFRTVIVEVARQNGKTLCMEVLGLWKLYVDGCSEILSAAQDLSVAEKTLKEAFNLAKTRDALRAYLPFRMERGELVPYMRTANGGNMIQLADIPSSYPEDVLDVSGTMPSWYVVATNRGGGRSYSADMAMLDELREHQTFDSWNGIVPATRERPRNQVWGFSNAGDKKSVVLKKQRTNGLRAIESEDPSTRTALFSWSAPDGCSIFDPEGWAMANPSLGYGNRTERDMLADAENAMDPTDPEGSVATFRTEYLCQWVETMEVGKIDPEVWRSLTDEESERAEGTSVYVGVDVAPDGKSSHISVAAVRPDGRVHVEEVASRAGYEWVPEWFTQRLGGPWFTGEVGIQVKGAPSAPLAALLEETEGITVRPWQGSDMPTSVLGFYRAINSDMVRHRGQPGLNAAAEGVRDRRAGDVWIWGRGDSVGNASPFIAANIAWWLMRAPASEDAPRSAYEDYPDDPAVQYDNDNDDYDNNDEGGGLLLV